MARAIYKREYYSKQNNVLTPASYATTTIYEAGTSDLLAATIYRDRTGPATLSNPVTADINGELKFYLELPQAIKTVTTATNLGTLTEDDEQVITAQNDFVLVNPNISGQLLLEDGSAAAPAIGFINETDLGLRRKASKTLSVGLGGTSELIICADPASSQRAYIADESWDKIVFQVQRGGGVTSGAIPHPDFDGAFISYSFNRGAATAGGAATSGTGVKGSAYAVQGYGGFHVGVGGFAESTIDGTWLPGTNANGLIGVTGVANGYKTGSRVWGSNFIARSNYNANSSLCAQELGVESISETEFRYGLQIVTLPNGSYSGSTEDMAIKLADKRGVTVEGNLWDTGLGFGSPGVTGTVGYPIKSTGTLIKSFGDKSVAYGIDFNTNLFSGAVLRASGFHMSGLGRMKIGSNTPATGTMLNIVNDGDAMYNIEFTNAPAQASVGAEITTMYPIIRVNGVACALKLYALS